MFVRIDTLKVFLWFLVAYFFANPVGSAADLLGGTKHNTTSYSLYAPRTSFTSSDPKLVENQWVAYLFGQNEFSVHPIRMTNLVKSKKTSTQIRSSLESAEEFGPVDAFYGEAPDLAGTADVHYMKEAEKRKILHAAAQDLLNLTLKYGPELATLVRQKKYEEAFQFADKNSMVRLLLFPVGFQVLQVPELSRTDMIKFYEAGQKNFALAKAVGKNPHYPREWKSKNNASTKNWEENVDKKAPQYPNFAFYNSKMPDPSTASKIMKNVIVPVALSVVTWGIGSAISTTISAAITTGSASVASGATAGVTQTAIKVGSRAVAGAVVGSAQGEDFGDALIKGALSGVVKSSVGGALVKSGVTDAVSSAVENEVAARIVNSVIKGTVVDTLLNGGDVVGAIQDSIVSASLNAALDNIKENNPLKNKLKAVEKAALELDQCARGGKGAICYGLRVKLDEAVSALAEAGGPNWSHVSSANLETDGVAEDWQVAERITDLLSEVPSNIAPLNRGSLTNMSAADVNTLSEAFESSAVQASEQIVGASKINPVGAVNFQSSTQSEFAAPILTLPASVLPLVVAGAGGGSKSDGPSTQVPEEESSVPARVARSPESSSTKSNNSSSSDSVTTTTPNYRDENGRIDIRRVSELFRKKTISPVEYRAIVGLYQQELQQAIQNRARTSTATNTVRSSSSGNSVSSSQDVVTKPSTGYRNEKGLIDIRQLVEMKRSGEIDSFEYASLVREYQKECIAAGTCSRVSPNSQKSAEALARVEEAQQRHQAVRERNAQLIESLRSNPEVQAQVNTNLERCVATGNCVGTPNEYGGVSYRRVASQSRASQVDGNDLGELLGEGSNSTVYRTPDGSVLKVLNGSDPVEAANTIVDRTNDMREHFNFIPEMRLVGSSQISQDFVEGFEISQLSGEARELAGEQAREAVGRANRVMGEFWTGEPLSERMALDVPGSSLDGRFRIDPNIENFRFNADGTIASWFDPVFYTNEIDVLSEEIDSSATPRNPRAEEMATQRPIEVERPANPILAAHPETQNQTTRLGSFSFVENPDGVNIRELDRLYEQFVPSNQNLHRFMLNDAGLMEPPPQISPRLARQIERISNDALEEARRITNNPDLQTSYIFAERGTQVINSHLHTDNIEAFATYTPRGPGTIVIDDSMNGSFLTENYDRNGQGNFHFAHRVQQVNFDGSILLENTGIGNPGHMLDSDMVYQPTNNQSFVFTGSDRGIERATVHASPPQIPEDRFTIFMQFETHTGEFHPRFNIGYSSRLGPALGRFAAGVGTVYGVAELGSLLGSYVTPEMIQNASDQAIENYSALDNGSYVSSINSIRLANAQANYAGQLQVLSDFHESADPHLENFGEAVNAPFEAFGSFIGTSAAAIVYYDPTSQGSNEVFLGAAERVTDNFRNIINAPIEFVTELFGSSE